MKNKKIDKDVLLEAIYKKFVTLDALADALDTSKQNISEKVKRQSPKFLKQLKDIGIQIEVPFTQSYTVHDESFQKNTEGERMQGNFIGEPREYNYNGITSSTLERVIKPYEDLIEMLKLQLAEKEKRIRELEEQLTNKKRGVP